MSFRFATFNGSDGFLICSDVTDNQMQLKKKFTATRTRGYKNLKEPAGYQSIIQTILDLLKF